MAADGTIWNDTRRATKVPVMSSARVSTENSYNHNHLATHSVKKFGPNLLPICATILLDSTSQPSRAPYLDWLRDCQGSYSWYWRGQN